MVTKAEREKQLATGKTVTVRPIPVYRQQADFLGLTESIIGFVGGRGTGKTRIGAHKIATRAKRDWPIICVSPDAGVITETTLPTFLDVVDQLGVYLDHKLTPYAKVWFRTQGGGTASIVFRSGEKPRKLEGPNYAMAWIDEASLQQQQVFLSLLPTLRFRGYMGQMMLTFTPKGRGNWTFPTFYVPIDEQDVPKYGDVVKFFAGKPYIPKTNTRLIHARSSDNPFAPPEFVQVIGGTMTSRLATQELGGEFIDIEGLMFSRHWFQLVDDVPIDATRVRYWDKAASPGSGCYTAGALIARDAAGIYYIEDVVRGQWSAEERNRWIIDTAKKDHAKYGGTVKIYAEQEGGSGGKEVMDQMIMMLAGYPIHRDIVGGKKSRTVDGVELPGEAKVVRAMPLAAQAEGGNVRIKNAKFTQELLDELCSFPESKYADQVDACSGAFNKVTYQSPRDFGSAQKRKVDDYLDSAKRFGTVTTLDTARRQPGGRSRRFIDRR